MEQLIWAGFSMTLFAAILTATKRKQSVSDKILSGWLFLFAIDYGNLGISSIFFDGILVPSTFFLFNPAFFLYARSLTDSKFKLRWIHLIHLIPYVIFELGKFIFPFNLNIYKFFNTDSTLWIRLLFAISLLSSIIIYNFLSIRIVHRHRMNLKNLFSNINVNHRITWLLFILVFYMVYIFSTTIFGFIGFIYNNFYQVTIYNYIISIGFTFTLGFYGIKQEEIFQRHINEDQNTDKKYRQSNLTDEQKQQIKTRLIDIMEKEQAFLNSDLNMPMLSDIFQIPKHQLTEVLNTEIGKNFFLFVNEYRVQAVKEKLANPENDKYSIEALAYDCGFNSKSSFFAVFKSITNQTPLQYRKSVRN